MIDEIYMTEALKEAQAAFDEEEVPVGCVIVYKRRIIARAHNQIKRLKDPTAHAEMIALTQAAAHLQNERLVGSCAYVTIEPCAMCAGAMVLGRVRRLIYGVRDPKTGACGSLYNIVSDRRLNHRVAVRSGILEERCRTLLRDFFKAKRRKNGSS